MAPGQSLALPDRIAHADWGTDTHKRWLALAEKGPNRVYRLHPPCKVTNAGDLLRSLRAQAGPQASILIGFDFPIGLPWTYANQIEQASFLELLPRLGGPEWPDFYRAADRPDQISLKRPFYPNRPGGSRQDYLTQALGVEAIDELRRRCEMRTSERRAAAPIFWTLGGQQVGKAAISGWRDVLAPALRQDPPAARIWPFDGPLETLLSPGATVIAETYPAEFYNHLGLDLGRVAGQAKYGKRSQLSRKANADRLIAWGARYGLDFTPALTEQILGGFGPKSSGEDPFDALIGLCGMINLVLGDERPLYEPGDPHLRSMEGWILGMQATESK